MSDEDRVQQILFNLIGNAIKFTKEGFVRVSLKSDNQNVTISIKDSGIGIKSEHLHHIFNSFEQGDSSVSRDYGGTGLGLSITKKLVELHGGTIEVESAIGNGSEFIFTLSRHLSPKEQKSLSMTVERESDGIKRISLPAIAEDDLLARKKDKGQKICIIDDDVVNLQVLRNYLELNGFAVTSFLNGKDFLNSFNIKNPEYDLLIIDLMMPGLSGFDLVKEIRLSLDKAQLPILIMTALDSTSQLNHCLRLGANDFMRKPYEGDELFSRVDNLLTISKLIKRNSKHQEEMLRLEQQHAKELEIKVSEKTEELKIANEKLLVQAVTDKLTGLYNRLKLDEVLNYELKKAARYGSVFSLILLDVDHFKNVNDIFGHQEGDKVLKHLAGIMDTKTRETDIVGRWGGEEFLIICPDTKGEDALIVAEKIRESVEYHDFGAVNPLTASFGISSYDKGDSSNELVERADKSLYSAKRKGRNNCVYLKDH